MEKKEFLMGIVGALRENPEWLPEAIQAFMAGASEAQQTMRDRVAAKDTAMLCALTLAKPNRLEADTKKTMNKLIRDGLAPKSVASPLERDFHKMAEEE